MAIALLDKAFETSATLRRLLLGDWYVEGKWVEYAEFADQTMIALIEFIPRGYSVSYTGENYDLLGKRLGRFESTLVGVKDNTLMSYGTTWGYPSTADGMDWHCTLTFGPPAKGARLHYSGEYKFLHRRETGRFSGIRVTRPDDLLGIADPARSQPTLARLGSQARELMAPRVTRDGKLS